MPITLYLSPFMLRVLPTASFSPNDLARDWLINTAFALSVATDFEKFLPSTMEIPNVGRKL